MNESISLPYGRNDISVSVPRDELLGVFVPRKLEPVPNPAKTLHNALANPVGSPLLREMAKGVRRVAVAVEDATRAVPNALLIDCLMHELDEAGVTPEQLSVVVATGLHRPMNPAELRATLGSWQGRLDIENHDASDDQRLLPVGTTSLGTKVRVNRTFMEADLKITTGDVEYHQFCGYGGGVKCVYPGMADAGAIRMNHSRMDLPGTGLGRLDGNPVREEIDELGRMVGVDFNVSVTLDPNHRIVAACAGDPDLSFRQACRVVDTMYAVEVPSRAGLVIASPGGHPKDVDLYQSQKAIEEATQIIRPGGDILLIAACEEGSGSELFEQWMAAAETPDDIIGRIREDFVMGGHKAYQIARELQRATIHLYSTIPPDRVRSWMMRPVTSEAGLAELIGSAESVAVLPQATLTRTVLCDAG